MDFGSLGRILKKAENNGPNAVWAENGRNHFKWTFTRSRSLEWSFFDFFPQSF
jgi:hypothetical protein